MTGKNYEHSSFMSNTAANIPFNKHHLLVGIASTGNIKLIFSVDKYYFERKCTRNTEENTYVIALINSTYK